MASRASEEKLRDRFGLVGKTLGDYLIERVVATGGFGVVYYGSHQVIRQPAAIKVLKLPDTLDPQERDTFARMFLDEAQTIAALKHPAIVNVLDFKVSPVPFGGDTPWMALEWIEGETLAHQLATRRGKGGRTPRECLDLLAPIFDALALAHARGVVHRDIKPANIMLPSKNSRFAVPARLLDFGIAKLVDPDADPGSGYTETTSPIQAFSLPYAASEQISGRRSGPWTDVHALALTLVEMLVDRPPFAGADRGQIVMQVLSSERPTPSRFGVDAGAWEPVLAKALSLSPAERYSNAGEFLTALERQVPTEVSRAEAAVQSPPAPTPPGRRAGSRSGPRSPCSAPTASPPPCPPRRSREAHRHPAPRRLAHPRRRRGLHEGEQIPPRRGRQRDLRLARRGRRRPGAPLGLRPRVLHRARAHPGHRRLAPHPRGAAQLARRVQVRDPPQRRVAVDRGPAQPQPRAQAAPRANARRRRGCAR
jgi:serine/threonine-protein kinase